VTRTGGIPGTGVCWTDRAGRHTGAHYYTGPGSAVGWVIVAIVAVAMVFMFVLASWPTN
jgi:hypothetical protein